MVLPLIGAVAGAGLGLVGGILAYAKSGETAAQRDARKYYSDMAAGKGPSYAERLIQAQVARAERDAVSMAQTVRTDNPLAALRATSQASNDFRRDATAQAATIRAREQMAAIQGLQEAGNAQYGRNMQQGAMIAGMFSGLGSSLTGLTGGMGGMPGAGAAPAAGAPAVGGASAALSQPVYQGTGPMQTQQGGQIMGPQSPYMYTPDPNSYDAMFGAKAPR